MHERSYIRLAHHFISGDSVFPHWDYAAIKICFGVEVHMSPLQQTVLCIDHHWSRLVERKQLLEANGYAVIDAIDAAEGLKLFRTRAVDAIALYYQLPGMYGDVAAARMKRMKPHVPILLLSAYGPLPDNKLESVDAFLTTSQETKYLVSTVRRLLASRAKPFFHRWFAQWGGRNAGGRP